MVHLGKMDGLKWNPPLQRLVVGRDLMLDEDGFPTEMPVFPDGVFLFGVIDQGFGENVFLCESLEDIQSMLDHHAVWFSGQLPTSANAPTWESKTGWFTQVEIQRIEVYNLFALKMIMLLHRPIEAMRALAELLLHEDQRLDELLMDPEVTAHWKDWAFGGNGYEPKDCEYVIGLDRRRTQLTDRPLQQQ